jgi:hypothetical protein
VKPRTLITAFALLAAIAVAAPSTTGAASLFKPCSGSFDPQGKPGGGFYRKITAKRVTCDTARSITKAWVVAHKTGSTNPTKKSIVKGYACTGKATSNGVLKILCAIPSGQKAVRFEGSP